MAGIQGKYVVLLVFVCSALASNVPGQLTCSTVGERGCTSPQARDMVMLQASTVNSRVAGRLDPQAVLTELSAPYELYPAADGCADDTGGSGWLTAKKPYSPEQCASECTSRGAQYNFFTIASGDKNCKCHVECGDSNHGHTAYSINHYSGGGPAPAPPAPCLELYPDADGCSDDSGGSGWLTAKKPYSPEQCASECVSRGGQYKFFTIASGDKNCKCHVECGDSNHGHTAYRIKDCGGGPAPAPPAPAPPAPAAGSGGGTGGYPAPAAGTGGGTGGTGGGGGGTGGGTGGSGGPAPPAPAPPAPAPPAPAAGDAGNKAPSNSDWLSALNAKRADHGACALSWNNVLADDILAYMKTLESLVHDQTYDLPPPHGPCGENLAWASDGATMEMAVDGWYSEVNNCAKSISEDGCEEGAENPDGSKQMTGHFTAMSWKGAREVGCAIFENFAGCRFMEKGATDKTGNTPNMGGFYVQNVGNKGESASGC